jgi:4-hydroxy-4-methyl-2-oxoglutarate aldolase
MTDPLLSTEQCAQLRGVDSPTIANIIELFGVRSPLSGYADGTLRAVYPELPPAVGYAVTATYRAGARSADETRDELPRMLELAAGHGGPAIAVFEDLDQPARGVTYGEIMATTFKTFGFYGLITSGAGRDIEQVRRLRFPCWASSMVVSHGDPRILRTGVPVSVAGLRIEAGDLLHGDGNGIVQVPRALAPAVCRLIPPYLAFEERYLAYLRGPAPTIDGFKALGGEARSALERLRAEACALVSVARHGGGSGR